MADHVSEAKRSAIMASVAGKNTQPEHFIRKLLFGMGYRFRLHDKKLPGKPDIVLKKYNAIILVNGCFWHGHTCHLFKGLPKTKTDFWQAKISKNKSRDLSNISKLQSLGWRTCIVWECALKRKHRLSTDSIVELLEGWLNSTDQTLEIYGIPN